MEQLSRLFLEAEDIQAEHSDDLDSVITHQQQIPEGDAQPRDDCDPIALYDTAPDFTVSVSSAIDVITPLISSPQLATSSLSEDKVSCLMSANVFRCQNLSDYIPLFAHMCRVMQLLRK